MTVEQSWVGRQSFWRLGATAQVQFNGIYFISLRGGQCAAAAAAAAVVPAVVAARALPVHAWPPLAPCPHVVMVESGMRAAMAVRCDSERAMRSAECRQPAQAAATRLIALSCACTCIAMLSVRMPVHDVVESDRTNRVYSDGKCILCEYLRLFAARGGHAIARACDGKARGFMVSQACTQHTTTSTIRW